MLQRGLEAYRKKIRQRATEILREFLMVQRLPRAMTFRDVLDLVESVMRGRRHVPWMFEWVMRHRGRWLAIKWAWYIRQKEYWRSKFEDLAREIDLYRKMYNYVIKNTKYLVARMSAWVDSKPLTEAELCTARVNFGDVANVLNAMRRLMIYDDFMAWAMEIRRAWPNRLYRVYKF